MITLTHFTEHLMPAQSAEILDFESLAARIPDGSRIALPPDYSGCAMAAVRALMQRPVRDLHIVAVPSGGMQVDMLIGAGCVARVEAAAVTMGENGLAPRFSAALKNGEIEMWDATCPAIQAGLQAAEKGIPFMPLRGIIGSDLLRVRPDWKVIDNPLAEDGRRDPIVILPAITPDVALFHALKADTHGNVWIGVRRELMLMAHASRQTFVTVERIEDGNFLEDPVVAAGTIPGLYISAIAEAKNGAWPIELPGAYPADRMAQADYVKAARTTDGFAQWAAEVVHEKVPA
jgi:glutaconate CoA-transferase subunit A